MKHTLLRTAGSIAVVVAVLILVLAAVTSPGSHNVASVRPATYNPPGIVGWGYTGNKIPCISGDYPGGEITTSYMASVTAITGITYTCANTFNNPVDDWTDWEEPWQFSGEGNTWQTWLTSGHQMILGEDLIPQSLEDMSDPLTWEAPCAAGDYNSEATDLAEYLLSQGAGSIVLRLGIEANGNWEADSVIGTDSDSARWTTEESDWGTCFREEAEAMEAVSGTHFLFVWNVNVCTGDIPLRNWYPGDVVVSIIGVDAYDVDCTDGDDVAQEGWTAYYTDSHDTWDSPPPSNQEFPSLKNIETFAAGSQHNRPLAFPEWGLTEGDDDPAYVNGLAGMVSSYNVSFQTYYDDDDDRIATLGDSTIPNATSAYISDFG